MKDIKDVVALVIENGGYHPFALELSKTYKKVYYYTPWESAFPSMADAVVGSEWENGEMLDTFDGFPLVRIKDMFEVLDEVDCVICPDVYNYDFQEYLRGLKKPVFGCFLGGELELDRWNAREMFKDKNMDLPTAKRIVGIDNLKKYLEKQKNKVWVKIGFYRKEFETFAHTDWFTTEIKLDYLAFKLGPLKHIVEFICEADLPDMNEVGGDGFFVAGEFCTTTVAGCENKGLAYAGKVFAYKDLNEPIKAVNEGLRPLLTQAGYQGAISTEIRSDGKKHYLLEPSTRLPSPPSELYQSMYTNLAEIVWKIANGEMPEIKTDKQYGVQMVLNINFQDELPTHIPVTFPEKYRDNIKLKNVIKIDGNYYSLRINDIADIGAIIAKGNSLKECRDKIEEVFNELKYPNCSSEMSHVDEAIEMFEEMEKESKK